MANNSPYGSLVSSATQSFSEHDIRMSQQSVEDHYTKDYVSMFFVVISSYESLNNLSNINDLRLAYIAI